MGGFASSLHHRRNAIILARTKRISCAPPSTRRSVQFLAALYIHAWRLRYSWFSGEMCSPRRFAARSCHCFVKISHPREYGLSAQPVSTPRSEKSGQSCATHFVKSALVVFLTSGKGGEIVRHYSRTVPSLDEDAGLVGGNFYLLRSCGVLKSLRARASL